ncbi:MAG: M28 family peptidase, partial [candidate division WOR-3 bacterium]
ATIVYSDEHDCYLRLDQSDIERLIALVRLKSRVWLRPLVLNNRQVSLPPVITNPLIEQMVQNVRPESVLSYVRRLQRYRTRYSTSDSCRAAAEWIRQKFLAYGCDSVYFEYHTSGHAPNVIGIRYGTAGQRNPYAIIDGHFDSYAPSNAPGADDNASGVAATLEACRVMQPYRFSRDLRYIAFSGEEFGLYGSEYYAARARSRGDSILGVLNFDMIGYVDAMPEDLQLVTKIANPPCGPFSDWFTAVADTYTNLICTKYMVNDNQNSDHGPFWNNGYVAFCGIEDFWPVNPYYHTAGDSIGAGYNNNDWCTEVTKAAVAALATLGQPVPVNKPLVGFLRSRVQDSAGNNNGFWDPGESVAVYVTLKNFGMVTATGVSASISTSDPYVTLFSATSGYGSIAPQETAVSLQPYLMRAAANTPREHVVSFTMNIVSAESSWVTSFDLTIGRYLVTDPVPDGPRQPPLYWAYDDIDTGYAQHPVFNWVEIRQQGTRLNYAHNDDVIVVNLPAGFGPIYFYGQRYTQVSVSADGWVAMGNYTTRNYTNTSLPNSSAPRAAVFANWDDLDPVVAGAVYYWHDSANHRLVIEYDSVAYYNPNTVREKFEIMFYDTTLAPASGDNVIMLQYLTANRYTSSTVGIQDQTQTVAICDLFNGTYAHGAAPIAPRRAIRMVTELTGVAESAILSNRHSSQSLVRGALYLAPAEYVPGCALYDPAGRQVLELKPGLNHVGSLPAGVYFVYRGRESSRAVIVR